MGDLCIRSAYSDAGNTVSGPILGIYKLLKDKLVLKLGIRRLILRKRNKQMGFSLQCALIKKKIKFSSYVRKFRVDQLQTQTYIYEEGLSNI